MNSFRPCLAILLLLLVTLTHQKSFQCNSLYATGVFQGVAICKQIGAEKTKCKVNSCTPRVSEVTCLQTDKKYVKHTCDGSPTGHEYINGNLVCRTKSNQFFSKCWLTATPVCTECGV
ncbi:secreted protein [Melampsora americana]|nr:secreted protein [Melampsora americana]